uniref:Uncharacterized protein n=1 Tax=Anguilla anguilla TaxID=7936 RepID=A0A0E9R2P9_ANGAN
MAFQCYEFKLPVVEKSVPHRVQPYGFSPV